VDLLSSLRRPVAVAGVFVASLAVLGCGAAGGGPDTTIVVENLITSSQAIVQVEFDFAPISLLPSRVESVLIPPGSAEGFGFDSFESTAFVSITVTWEDFSTDTLPLPPFAGGELTIPFSN
jgi:hypothetical protein